MKRILPDLVCTTTLAYAAPHIQAILAVHTPWSIPEARFLSLDFAPNACANIRRDLHIVLPNTNPLRHPDIHRVIALTKWRAMTKYARVAGIETLTTPDSLTQIRTAPREFRAILAAHTNYNYRNHEDTTFIRQPAFLTSANELSAAIHAITIENCFQHDISSLAQQ